ncbi:MAG: hypothetical protein WA194_07050 [Patescibacteria group bacterium]
MSAGYCEFHGFLFIGTYERYPQSSEKRAKAGIFFTGSPSVAGRQLRESRYGERSYRHGERHVGENLLEGFRTGEFFRDCERPLGERDDEEPLGERNPSERGDQDFPDCLGIGTARYDCRAHDDGEQPGKVGQSSVSFEISHKASEHFFVRKSADADGEVDEGEYLQNDCVAHSGMGNEYRSHSSLSDAESSGFASISRILREKVMKTGSGACVFDISIRIRSMFDRIPFRLMPKAFRTFSKSLLALVFFALPNLVPQGVSASSGDTFSGSVFQIS